MKKVLLTFGLCISVLVSGDQVCGTDVAAVAERFTGTNTVYVYRRADGAALSGAEKSTIWGLETTLKFPTCAGDAHIGKTLERYPRLLTDERSVFKEKLGDGYEITPCSASLYQLFILKRSLAKINESPCDPTSRESVQNLRRVVKATIPEAFSPGAGRSDCAEYLGCPEVKTFFWNLNDYIIAFFDSHGGPHQETWSTSQLKEFARSLIDDLCSELVIGRTARKAWTAVLDDKELFNFPSVFARDLYELAAHWSDYALPVILNCLYDEIDTMVEGRLAGKHSIYRGEINECSCLTAPIGSVAFSFGDGLFSGIMHDRKTAMPMSFALKTGRLVRVDLYKRDIIDGTCPFFMQFVPALASGLGRGEKFHPRMCVSRESVQRNGGIAGAMCSTSYGANSVFSADVMPELISDRAVFTLSNTDIVISQREIPERVREYI